MTLHDRCDHILGLIDDVLRDASLSSPEAGAAWAASTARLDAGADTNAADRFGAP